MPVAVKALLNESSRVRYFGLYLFKDLVEKKQAYFQAEKAAEDLLTDSNGEVRYWALLLFQSLVENGQSQDKAVKAAEVVLVNPEEHYLNSNLAKSLLY